MNRTIRCGPLASRVAIWSCAAVLAAATCYAHGDDGDGVGGDPTPVLGSSLPIDITAVPPLGQGLPVTGYNSRPGAPYTVYLDFGGFTFPGSWGGTGYAPGTTPAYDVDGNASTFNATESANIKEMWSRVAEKYIAFNVNVTTVDPAVAAGFAGSDSQRQAYYDNTMKLMHTVIGGSGSWYGPGGGGVSYIGVTANSQSGSNGYHTDWVFAAQAPTNLRAISEATAHENGHGFNLNHQSDYAGSTLIREYSDGSIPGPTTGPGSKAPIMGKSYNTERGLWKIGTAIGNYIQNDLATILNSNFGIGPFINDGVGHTVGSATPLPFIGTTVDYNLAKGIIVPLSSNPPPTSTSGAANYQSDYWSFSTDGGIVSLSVVAGRETITPGVADPGATLDASLEILNTSGSVLFSSATPSLNETLTVPLPAGDYIAHVMSAADPLGLGFYDIGSYFLTGNTSVPEPSTLALLFGAAVCLTTRRRRVGRQHVRVFRQG